MKDKKIPDTWIETSLGEIAQWGSGGTPNRSNPNYFKGQIPWIKTGELNDNVILKSEEHISEEALKQSSAKIFPKDSVLIAMYGATIGKTAILGVDASTNQACAVAQPYKGINNKYLYYYLKSEKENFIAKGKGGAQPNISQTVIKEHKFPLAPYNEQIKIVQKLDELFNSIGIVNNKVNNIPSFIKHFKQNVLEQAISGKLTKEWRLKNKSINVNKDNFILNNKKFLKSKISDTWVSGNISDLFLVNPGHKGISIEDNLLVSFIPMASIEEENGTINTRVHRQYKEVKSGFTKFIEGDVLFAKITPCMENGKVGIATGLKNGLGCGTTELHVFREQIEGTNIILFYHFLLESFRQKAKNNFQGSSGHLRVPVSFFEDFKIDLPPKEEIEQIQKKVDELFKYIENIENHFIELKKVVHSLPNNVLNKAFSGELVKQDPNDESAEVLLGKIREEKSNQTSISVKKTKRSHKSTNDQENFKQQLETLKGLIRKKLIKIKIDKELSNQDLINIISNESSNQELIYDVMQELIQENAITQIYDKRKKEFYFKINESIKH